MMRRNEATEEKLIRRLSQMKEMASELLEIDTVKLANNNNYIRIGGESFRAVSLREDYPLCGCSKSGNRKLASIYNHFENFEKEPSSLESHILDKKEERSLQCWIIKQSLINSREMIFPLNLANSSFDKLRFALDEVSLGDKNNPVSDIRGIKLIPSSRLTAVRCDILAVGEQNGKTFPVIIELKSNRNMKNLKGGSRLEPPAI